MQYRQIPDFIQVEAEERRFFCQECGEAFNLIVYPPPDDLPAPLRIDCICGVTHWWSRKDLKLYNGFTRAELHPDCFMLLGRIMVNQLVKLKAEVHE